MKDSYEVSVPKRARGTLHQKSPQLEETLEYFLSLLHPNATRGTEESPRGMGGTEENARELGMNRRRFQRYLNHPHWTTAREVAARYEKTRTREKTFGEYVFKHLTPEARVVWQKLQFWVDHEDAPVQIQELMKGRAVPLKQELFIHALVSTHYDLSRALYLTGLSRRTLEYWIKHDLEFAQLVEEIQWHKKNFFETAMLDLVAERNPLAVIWTNKTVNADRGYSEKIRVEHEIKNFDLEALDLDLETRKKVLDAIRRQQAQGEGPSGRHLKRLLPAPEMDVEEVLADSALG